jgi:CO/xanthine dehydrogenase FAD-binding subunit
MLPKFTYVRPTSVNKALAILDDRPAVIHGGGTDLLGCLRDGIFTTDTVLSLSAIEGLRGIRTAGNGGIHIGALTTVASVAADPAVVERYPVLAEAARSVASPQLRNQGTIAGNLRNLFRLRRRESVPLHFRRRHMLHRPPVGHCARAGRARRRLPGLRPEGQPFGTGREAARTSDRGSETRDGARSR